MRRLALIGVVLALLSGCSDDRASSDGPVTTASLPTVVDVDHASGASASATSVPSTSAESTTAGSTSTTSTTAAAVHVEVRLDIPAQQLGFAGTRDLTGGLGGEVVVVTSASDAGPGTYREALESGGERIIRFDRSLDGESIHLQTPVEVTGSNITLDGSDVDITVSGHSTRFSGTNIVIAGMAFHFNDDLEDDDAVTFRDATQTQVAGLFFNEFMTAADGLVDVIWNDGHDVYVTMCGNAFSKHDKGVLIDSGDDDREGGLYHVTMCDNVWTDVYQRAPLSRRALVHQFNSLFERFGEPDGEGGGSKAGGDGTTRSQHLLQNNIAIPRAVGESTWDDSVVTHPRTEWAGPQLGHDSFVRVEGSLLETVGEATAGEVENDPEQVFTPPYEFAMVAASPELASVLRATAGVCIPVRAERVSPCAPLHFVEGDRVLDVVVEGDVAEVAAVRVVGAGVDLEAEQIEPGRWQVTLPERLTAAIAAVAETTDGAAVWSDVGVVAVMP